MSFFFNLGRKVGHGAIPAIRQSKLIWDGLTGTEEEVIRAERALGGALATELRAVTELSGEAGPQRFANEICQVLASRLKNRQFSFRCEITHAEEPNAMALPGGFIFLSDSLINLCQSRADQLAFVIGHEMAHVVRGHVRERLLNQTALRAASAVLSRSGPLGGWLRENGLNILRDAHSRDSELEADELGWRLATAAGYEPAGAFALLQTVHQLGLQDAGLGSYFTSHPPALERMAHLKPLMRKIAHPPEAP